MLVLFQECLDILDLEKGEKKKLMQFKQDEVGAVAVVDGRFWLRRILKTVFYFAPNYL